MLSTLIKFLRSCWLPSSSDSNEQSTSNTAGKQDGLLWYKDMGQHLTGDYSMAVVQANNLLEDQAQIESGNLSLLESGPFGTFVGVYDGHGGPETSRYITDHLFLNLKSKLSANYLAGVFSGRVFLTTGLYNFCVMCLFQGLLQSKGHQQCPLTLYEEHMKQQKRAFHLLLLDNGQ